MTKAKKQQQQQSSKAAECGCKLISAIYYESDLADGKK